jgi:hypothetical protein
VENALLILQSTGDTFGKPILRIKAYLDELDANVSELAACINELIDNHDLGELQKQADAEQ